MKINLHSPVEEVQIQIIPLIDVVFCILTFFILAALQFTRQQAINVDLPKAGTGTAPQARQILPVTIDAVGQIYVEKQPVKQEQLLGILQNYRQQNPYGTLVLNASRSAIYNEVVEVLDLMRQVGGDRVALATLPASSDQPINTSPAVPNVPSAPGATPLPNSVPVAPLGTPNPSFPSAPNPNQFSFPTAPGQTQNQPGINPANPSAAPVFPSAPAPQSPLTPGQTNPSPQR
jgi:biopolymer transport protein ExbD